MFLILLSSLNHISYSKSEEDQIVSSDSTPESNQEILPPGNLSLPSIDGAPILEPEDQSLSPDQYANGTASGHVEEPDFFAQELFSASPFPETLGTKPEANDHNSQITTPATARPDFALLETAEAFAEPEAINNSEIEAIAPALSTGSLRETKADEHYNSQIKSPEPVLSTEFTSPEANRSSAEADLAPEADNNDNSAIKSSVPASSVAIQLTEMHAASTAPLPSNLPNNHRAEDADNLAPQSIVDDNNTPSETTESAPSEESTSPKASQEAPSSGDIDDGVDTPPMINHPSILPSNYSAEDETVDIVLEEEDNGTWFSWKIGQNNLVMGGIVVGVCFVGLAGLVCNSSKNKKKTKFQYQFLSKGL